MDKSGLPVIAKLIFVPIAWPITWLLLRTRIKPNTVTVIRAILLAIAAIVTAFNLWGIALFVLVAVLDHVDGNIARIRNQATWFGKFFDGLVDIATDIALLPAVAIWLWRGGDYDEALVCMLGAIAVAFTYLVVYRLPLILLQSRLQAYPSWYQAPITNGLFNIKYVGLLLIAYSSVTDYAVKLAIVYMAASVMVLCSKTYSAWLSLNEPRKSKSAV